MATLNYLDLSWRQYWNARIERCGFVLLSGEIIEVNNIALDPEDNFEISFNDIEKYEGQIAASWHTHPRGSANLSQSDYQLFLQVPEWQHVVISKDEMTFYFEDEGCVFRGATVYGNH
jgi:proteasome lid subunit RPN8/RPN11